MSRRVLIFATVLLIGLIAAPVNAGSASPRALAPTSVVHLRPVNGKGHLLPGYTIKRTFKHGSCSAGSEATGSAYRCFAGNYVIDPCWVSNAKDFVVCVSAPWSFRAVQIHVTKGYSNAGFSKKHAKLPWGVQLANGTQCGVIQGAGGVVAGKRINYGCSPDVVLYGNVNKTRRVWTIHKARPTVGGGYRKGHRVNLAKAWFGKPTHKG